MIDLADTVHVLRAGRIAYSGAPFAGIHALLGAAQGEGRTNA